MLEWCDSEFSGVSVRIVAGENGIRVVAFHPYEGEGKRNDLNPVLRDAVKQLSAYFAGELRDFELPLDIAGTEFQKRVWEQLLTIPYGETRSYGEIAEAIGAPRAVRAVGAANGANPIAIVVPCHRVVGSNGKLTGYGGGLPLKKQLLALEHCNMSLFR